MQVWQACLVGAGVGAVALAGAFASFGAAARAASYAAGRAAGASRGAAARKGFRGGAGFGFALGLPVGAATGWLYPDDLGSALTVLAVAAVLLSIAAVCFGLTADLATRWGVRPELPCGVCRGRGGYRADLPGRRDELWLACRACGGSGVTSLHT